MGREGRREKAENKARRDPALVMGARRNSRSHPPVERWRNLGLWYKKTFQLAF